jgi:hypothetical protein
MSEDTCCPQCSDNAWFARIGFKEHLGRIHEEAMKEADAHAKTWADSDSMNGCSLGWQKLWVVHFCERYEMLMKKKKEKVLSDYETECYKKSYGEKEVHICSYHGEFR